MEVETARHERSWYADECQDWRETKCTWDGGRWIERMHGTSETTISRQKLVVKA